MYWLPCPKAMKTMRLDIQVDCSNQGCLDSAKHLSDSASMCLKSKKISNDQELIQSDPISCPQNQKGNN